MICQIIDRTLNDCRQAVAHDGLQSSLVLLSFVDIAVAGGLCLSALQQRRLGVHQSLKRFLQHQLRSVRSLRSLGLRCLFLLLLRRQGLSLLVVGFHLLADGGQVFDVLGHNTFKSSSDHLYHRALRVVSLLFDQLESLGNGRLEHRLHIERQVGQRESFDDALAAGVHLRSLLSGGRGGGLGSGSLGGHLERSLRVGDDSNNYKMN
mmetsp:Transcript_81312/g.169987  ORF Transcript_81312/g.169987 Transcript_81312/m.169987 type:complete len:207 (-) Transcript_81312:87-707(-)